MRIRVVIVVLFLASVLLLAGVIVAGIGTSSGNSIVKSIIDRSSEGSDDEETDNDDADIANINRQPLKLPLVAPRIVVNKRARRLMLHADGRVVRKWRIGLGKKPVGDKLRQGDRRTPEGTFYICQKNPNSQYYLSLGISYPAPDDARRGLRSRLITQQQHDAIVNAYDNHSCPPWNTALGGEVFIHGKGSQSDWTWGCIALDDDAMKELFDVIAVGTVVIIKP